MNVVVESEFIFAIKINITCHFLNNRIKLKKKRNLIWKENHLKFLKDTHFDYYYK